MGIGGGGGGQMKTLLIFSCTKGHQGRGQREEPLALETVLCALALSSPA